MNIHCNVDGSPSDVPVLVADDGARFPGDLTVPHRCSFAVPDTINGGFAVMWGRKWARSVFPPYPREHQYEGGLLDPPLPAIDYAPEFSGLRATGEHFIKGDGTRWIAALHSDFRLYKNWLDGIRPDALLDQRQQAGSNGPRVFLSCGFLFQLDPRAYGERFYAELPVFSRYLADRGLYWEATVFTDRQMTGLPDWHWQRCCEALAGQPNVIIELANEYFKNGIDPRTFSAIPNGCPQSPGSFVDGMYPIVSWPNGYQTFHPSRNWKWPATVGITLWELKSGFPGVYLVNEPMGAAEYEEPGKRSMNDRGFGLMAQDSADFGAGGVFHSQQGLQSEPWGPAQNKCAMAFFAGLRR